MEVVLELPDHLRGELKDPFGPIYTDATELLAVAGRPVIAVGDVVTYHLLQAGTTPDVSLIDGKTEREAVDDHISAGIEGFDTRLTVANPAATLTDDLLSALRRALDSADTTVIVVETGEEDLAAVPAIVAADEGAAVVYGQPGAGMVLASVDEALKSELRGLMERMDGDVSLARRLLDLPGR